jgi:hypothetical protein
MTTRDQRRSRRARTSRACSVPLAELKRAIRAERAAPLPRHLPMVRSECIDQPRPCPFVSCKHHLYLDVTKAGAVKLNFPDLEVHELAHSCSLDVADDGGATLESVGMMLNLTRERVRQLELIALGKFEAECATRGLNREGMLHEIEDRSVKP